MFHDVNGKYSEILLVYKYKNGKKVVSFDELYFKGNEYFSKLPMICKNPPAF